MPIPDDRQVDEYEEEPMESTALPEMLDENDDELEFETADADSADDDSILDPEAENADADTAGFGFGDPAD